MLRFGKKDRLVILESMKKDLQLLSLYNMMDYSLLLCIEKNPDYTRVVGRSTGSFDRTTFHQSNSSSISQISGRRSITSQELSELRSKF